MDGLQTKQFDLLEIAGDRMPIGNYFKVPPPFATHTMELRDEDQLVLYTDGFADQFGGDQNKKYKYGKLKRFLLENREHTQSRITKAALSHEFNAWKGSSEQTDDVCIVVIEIWLHIEPNADFWKEVSFPVTVCIRSIAIEYPQPDLCETWNYQRNNFV